MLQAGAGELAHAGGALAHAAREYESVETAEARDHGRDAGSQPVDVDAERELRLGVVAREQLAHVSGPGEPEKTGLMLERVGHLVHVETSCCWSHSRSPGSTEPERVAITSPSSGVKPIVVSTERPSRTAHSDAPAPR